MSSSQVYSNVPIRTSEELNSAVVSSEWYGPSSYAYEDSYITPFPSSTVESQAWTQYVRSSVPDISVAPPCGLPSSLLPPQQLQTNVYPPHFRDLSRPRSSPSTFGPAVENMNWPTTNSGLGIFSTTGATGQPKPITSTFSTAFHAYPPSGDYSTSSPPEIRQPQPRKPYTPLAPNPEQPQLHNTKRRRDDGEDQQQDFLLESSVLSSNSISNTPRSSSKRRKRTSSVASADLSEDDRFLVQLKEKESLPWKDIATRFQTDRSKHFQVAALQMRYKRLREKFRLWEDQDLQALRLAHEYWEKYKWEIIAGKMTDFGVSERWPARHVARKWTELEAPPISSTTPLTLAAGSMTPAVSAALATAFSSPADTQGQFAFLPVTTMYS